MAEQLQVFTDVQGSNLQLGTDFNSLFAHIQAPPREKDGASHWAGGAGDREPISGR